MFGGTAVISTLTVDSHDQPSRAAERALSAKVVGLLLGLSSSVTAPKVWERLPVGSDLGACATCSGCDFLSGRHRHIELLTASGSMRNELRRTATSVQRTVTDRRIAIGHQEPQETVSTRGRTITGSAQLCSDLANGTNPVFFVSSSPGDLHNSHVTFIRHTVPGGPGAARDLLGTSTGREQKPRRIQEILDLHPRLRFVLIGDSGAKDREIYAAVARADPGRTSRSISARFGATRAMVGWRRSRTPGPRTCPSRSRSTPTRPPARGRARPPLRVIRGWGRQSVGPYVAMTWRRTRPSISSETPTSCPSRRGPRRRCRGCRGARRCTASRRRRHLAGSVPS